MSTLLDIVVQHFQDIMEWCVTNNFKPEKLVWKLQNYWNGWNVCWPTFFYVNLEIIFFYLEESIPYGGLGLPYKYPLPPCEQNHRQV